MNIGDEVPEVCWTVDESMLCPICNTNCIEDYDAVHYCPSYHQYTHNGKKNVRIEDRTNLNLRIYHTRWYNIFKRIHFYILSKELARIEGDQYVSFYLPKLEEVKN